MELSFMGQAQQPCKGCMLRCPSNWLEMLGNVEGASFQSPGRNIRYSRTGMTGIRSGAAFQRSQQRFLKSFILQHRAASPMGICKVCSSASEARWRCVCVPAAHTALAEAQARNGITAIAGWAVADIIDHDAPTRSQEAGLCVWPGSGSEARAAEALRLGAALDDTHT